MSHNEIVSSIFRPNGPLSKWGELSSAIFPEYPERTFNLLLNEGIIPKQQKDHEPFTVWGPAFNNAWIETEFALFLDEHFNNPNNKPLVYASDIVYSYGDNEQRIDEKLENAVFAFMRHEASKTPIPDDSIDIILDNLGALWFLLKRNQEERTKKLLNIYITKLKKGGSLVLDATEHPGLSTAELVLNNFSYKKLEEIGFIPINSENGGFIEDDKYKLLVLKKQ